MELMRPVAPANPIGLPSACVPAGRDAATGLPIGVLLTGRRFREPSVSKPPKPSKRNWLCPLRLTRPVEFTGAG